MMLRRAPTLVALATVLLLGACAELRPLFRDNEQGNPEPFEMLGRMYVRYGAQAVSGTLRWAHATERDEVWIGGPLGQTGAHIVRDVSGAALTTASQQTYRAMSIESLTREGLGWSFPLVDLSYYVLGDVPPGAAAPQRVPDEDAWRLDHNGWAVQWTPREPPGDAAAPPARLTLVRDDVEIRLVVDQLQRPQ